MSETGRFDVLVFGSGTGGKLTRPCRWIMPEYRLPADEKRDPQREGGRLRPS